MMRLKMCLAVALAALGISAIASASASALHWYELVGGVPSLLPEGSPTEVVSTGANFKLTSKVVGVNVEIRCAKAANEGDIENPDGGGTGKGLLLVHFLECVVPKPAGGNCLIVNDLIHTKTKIELVTVAMQIYIKFSPDLGTNGPLAIFDVEKCNNPLLDGEYAVEGNAYGRPNNMTGITAFLNEAPNNELKLDGNPAVLTGETTMQYKVGGSVIVGV
jgi:hypothetical protein